MKRIAIHSVPRSGSTWMGSIFDSHPNVVYKFQPLFSYPFKGYLTPTSEKKDIDSFFEKISKTEDPFIDQKEAKKKGKIPSFEKKTTNTIVYKEVRYHNILDNLLQKDKTIMVIGLIRNPLSTLFSWINAPSEFRKEKGWKIDEEWRFAPKKNRNKPEEFNGYQKWKEVALLFHILKEKFPDQFHIVNYHDLLHNTEETIRNIFSLVGLNFSNQTCKFIKSSKSHTNNDAYSVYKKKKGDEAWQGKLNPEIIQFIKQDLHSSFLKKYL